MTKVVILVSAIVAMSSLLNLGTVRKKEDPVLKTQTDPISYKQKMEEMKDGPKGAPTPSFNLYPKAGFMTDPAVEVAKEEAALETETPDQEQVTEVSAAEDEEAGDWWSDEKNDDSEASPQTSNETEAEEASEWG